ncbi:MIPT3 protein, partial [Pedionomus torquatus]|nr:MIPT3 protein [Pedionomus torquatus]
MNEAVVRETQESLGRVIRKPPLTDRLLSKPPFRYLHDVITEVIRVTGFMKGLYTDFELKSDNIKDKDAKISFLQKAIDAVVMVTGEPLSVKPARVVAGHEPEKTNEFLQAIGKCCLNKLSSDVAVKKILAGERADAKEKLPSSKSRDKESRESKTEEQKTRKEGRGDTEIKDRSSSRDRKPKGDLNESEEREKESDKQKRVTNEERHKDPERGTFKEGEKQEKERNKSRTTKQAKETEKSKGKRDVDDLEGDKGQEREKKNDGGKEKDRLKGRDKDKSRDRERDKDRDRGKDRERDRQREKEGEHFREHGKDKAEKKSETPAGISRQPSTKGSRQRATPQGEAWVFYFTSLLYLLFHLIINCFVTGTVEIKNMTDRISEDNVAKPQEKAEPGLAVKQKGRHNKKIDCLGKSNLSASGHIPRPSSARPAPPRVKRQESTEVLLPERNGGDKAVSNVIIDQQFSDDDDQFVVEAAPLLPDMPETETKYANFSTGGLVKRILETKKDYEASQKSSKTTEREKPFVSEVARKKERDLVAKEIEKFQVSIQTLCRSALTLGRIMDYVQEDMDAMKNELQMWRQENRQHAEALQKEQSITDSAVEPLKADLAELEQLIKDQQDKICAVKANILKNEEKIRRMVLSINLSSRR